MKRRLSGVAAVNEISALCRVIAARNLPVASLAAMGLVFAPAAPAAGTTITVNTTSDVTSVANGNCTILEAVRAALEDNTVDQCPAGSGDDDTVVLPVSAVFAFSHPYGSYTALADMGAKLTIEGNGSTLKRAPGADSMRAIAVRASGDLTVRNLRIEGFSDGYGAGILDSGGRLATSGVTIAGNAGPGVWVEAGGTATLADTEVSGNGIGVHSQGSSTLTLEDCTVSGNNGAGVTGEYSGLSLVRTTVDDNAGRGVHAFFGTLAITDSTISNNFAQGVVSDKSVLTMSGSTVSGNYANEAARMTNYITGGVHQKEASATITNSTISGNTAASESAGYLVGGLGAEYGATVRVVSSTITGNRTQGSNPYGAGGIYASNLVGSTSITLVNSIVDGNIHGAGGVTDCQTYAGAMIVGQEANVSRDDGCNASINAAADLGPLADNGGPTRTHALLDGSPAIDAATGTPVAADQRGAARPIGLAADLGAYEAADHAPDAFNFPNVTDAPRNVPVTSAVLALSGYDATTGVSVRNGEYSVNGGAWTSAAGTITPGQTLQLRLTSNNKLGGSKSMSVTVGRVSDDFVVKTVAVATDTNPDPFSIANQANANLNVLASSRPVTPVGYDAPATVSVTPAGCFYRVNGGGPVTSGTMLTPGDSLQLATTTPNTNATKFFCDVTVGTTKVRWIGKTQ